MVEAIPSGQTKPSVFNPEMVVLPVRFLQSALNVGRRLSPLIPPWPQQKLLCLSLNHFLQESRQAGDFDFLTGKTLAIEIPDLQQTFPITLTHARFTQGAPDADARISADLLDLLKIIAGQDDPDSLFFQRRLRISGDTELGLTAKNTLDAIDKNQLPHLLRQHLKKIIQLLERAAALYPENHDGTGMPSR